MSSNQTRVDLLPHQIVPRASSPESCLPGQPHRWFITPSGNTPNPHSPKHMQDQLTLHLPYVKGVSKRIEQDTFTEIKTTFKSQGTLWIPGPHKAASTSTEEKRGCVPCALCWLRLCVHRSNWKNTGEETEWAQRSSEEEWLEERHCSTCMEDTAQGGLGVCHSQASGDEPHTAKDHWSHPHQEAESHIQPGLWSLSEPSMSSSPLLALAPPLPAPAPPPPTNTIHVAVQIYIFWQHTLHHTHLTR